MNSKTTNIIGWVLTALVVALLLFSAVMKFSTNPQMTKNFALMGLSFKKIHFIAIVEIISAILFAIPRTGVLGTLLVAAYMGGAIATHLEHFMPAYMPVVIECVVFIAAVLRFPELRTRLFGQ